ncbi:retrovirus-related Pol polyprotein from transposon 412 [Trichonephila clavipes]|nr:retrovirus-related Pol polyprotein from transposon 412 [Trichonephila clavipes]
MWIQKEPNLLKTFVANRVATIQHLTNAEQWHHVSSEQNPADLVSRGLDPSSLHNNSLWWNGPKFLATKDFPERNTLSSESAVHDTTGYSPSQMLFGRDLRLPADLLFSRPPDAPLALEEYIEKLQERMEEMHHLARERIGMASEKMKTLYDVRATGHDFREGDKVWLWNPKRRKGLSPKLQTNWEGPYTVLKRLNDVVMRIQKSPHSKPKLSGYGHELVAGVSRTRVLLPLKTRRVDEAIPPSDTVVRKEGCQLRCPSRHSTEVQNYEVCDQ